MDHLKVCMEPVTLRRSVITCVLVGTIVTAINQGPAIAAGQMLAAWQVIFTYIVPFLVSMVSACMAKR